MTDLTPEDLPRSKLSRVTFIAAYWRNDEHAGIGITLPFSGSEGIRYCEAMEESASMMDEGSNEYREYVMSRVRAIGNIDRPKRGLREAHEAVMCIHWLQTRGHLIPDEYNGTLFTCVYGKHLVVSERNPLTATKDNIHVADLTDVVRAARQSGSLGSKVTQDALRLIQDHAREEARKK